jgi:RND superfamily putative drug exporter
LATLARWCFRHRRAVLAIWLVVLVAVGALSRSAGSSYANNFSFPATDSIRAYKILQDHFPTQSGDVDQIVVHARAGTLDDPATRAEVEKMLSRVSQLPHVRLVQSPYDTGLLSPDRTVGVATIHLDGLAQNVPPAAVRKIIDTARSAESATLEVQLGGQAISNAESNKQPASEAIGVLLSLVVLFFAFRRSLLSALLPLISALMAIGVGTSLIALLTHAFKIPEFGPILATLVALGVGVDYALFIVSRHRSGLHAGMSVEESAVLALDTSGRAVLFAGMIVCIALLGMFALQVSFLYGVAVSAALVVALTMLASLTLLPAMLGFFGTRVLRRAERRSLESGPIPERTSGFWVRLAAVVHDHALLTSLAALVAIIVVAIPFFGMRLGLPDAGNNPPASTSRQAYDLLAKAFGPGYNGPLEVVAEINSPQDLQRFEQFVGSLKGMDGVALVQPARQSPDGRAAVVVVYPDGSPQSASTADLVGRVRAAVPAAEAGTSLAIHVGGPTAGALDFAHVLAQKMPQFVAVVVILASLLLMVVFRSLLVPVLASVMNLLSIGAALGVLTVVFQWGWGQSLVGFTKTGPIAAFLPVMLFAILFGLSMDYEVFLVSRIHEEWMLTNDNDLAVQRGQAKTGPVITAAALIMILVFLSFVLGGQLIIKEFGIGFAGAVFIDAFVIRTVLVPSAMQLFGRANWWLPRWLDRILPVLHVEPPDGGAGLPPGSDPDGGDGRKVLELT